MLYYINYLGTYMYQVYWFILLCLSIRQYFYERMYLYIIYYIILYYIPSIPLFSNVLHYIIIIIIINNNKEYTYFIKITDYVMIISNVELGYRL